MPARPSGPAISTAAAKAAATEAAALAASPVALNVDGNRVGALSTAALQNAVMVRNQDGKATITFDPKVLAPAVGEVLGAGMSVADALGVVLRSRRSTRRTGRAVARSVGVGVGVGSGVCGSGGSCRKRNR